MKRKCILRCPILKRTHHFQKENNTTVYIYTPSALKKKRSTSRAANVSSLREVRGVSFHVLINSRVITGKLIPQSLSSI